MTLGIRRVGFHRSNHTGSLRPIQGLGSLAAGTPEGSPPAMTETAVLVPDLIEVHVPVGGRVLVVSDIHLARESTTASIFAATELAQTVESWTGPGVIVLAGDCFELLEGTVHDPRPALQTHARFADAHQREPSSPRLQADARGAMAQGVDERQPQRDRDDEWDQQDPGVAGHPPVGQARREEPREGDWIGQRFHSGEPGL